MDSPWRGSDDGAGAQGSKEEIDAGKQPNWERRDGEKVGQSWPRKHHWRSVMPSISKPLLLRSQAKDTRFGVTPDTVKALANELDVTEMQVIHLALSRLEGGATVI